MLVVRDRGAERGHDAVAHVVDDRAAVIEHRVGHQREVRVDRLDDLLDGSALGVAREPAEVSEQHRARQQLRPDPRVAVRPREDLVHHLFGQEPHEDVADALVLEIVQGLAVEPGVDARAQDRRVERLGQEVVGAGLQTADDALGVVDARDHDHGQVAELLVGLDALEDLDAVHAGHLDVEQDHVGRVLADRRQGRGPVVRRGGSEPLSGERRRDEPSVERVVVDDEDVPGSTLHPFLLTAPLTREARSPDGAAKECSTPPEAPATARTGFRPRGVRKGLRRTPLGRRSGLHSSP